MVHNRFTLLVLVLLGFSGSTSASAAVFTILGDIFDSANAQQGSFVITVDDANLTSTINTSNAGLMNAPWFGYSITTATVVLPTVFDETDVQLVAPQSGGAVNAQLYVEGAPLSVALAPGDFAIRFSDGGFNFANLGEPEIGGGGVGQDVINNVVNTNLFGGGNIQNLVVTAVPEPSTFAVCGLAAICLGVGRRRKKRSLATA